jgi:glycosyltransferase involved in cell wall biosynthesis
MADINFITPSFSRKTVTGGIWCILEYAHGLTARGHKVNIIPIYPTSRPEWFPRPVGEFLPNSPRRSLAKAGCLVRDLIFSGKISDPKRIRRIVDASCMAAPSLFSHPARLGLVDAYVRDTAPLADVNIATSFETARPVSLLPGRNFYFAQHFEPFFKNESADPDYVDLVARQSYRLSLTLIANSSWLREMLESEAGRSVNLSPNAINHEVYLGQPKPPRLNEDRVIIISYGGRNAVWKGFREMAHAVSLARAQMPGIDLEWRVYGDAILPPENTIAPYTALGFLVPDRLAEEYRRADILLSASWYESFPLFPLEAMACGLAVITSQLGTEDYAQHGVSAEIVDPRSPESIAEGLIRLVKDREYRYRVAMEGNAVSKQFTWSRSVTTFEAILLGSNTGKDIDEKNGQ